MNGRQILERLRQGGDDTGYTLVEILVAVVIAGILGGILMTMLLAAQSSTKSTTTADDLNGEARAALNRVSRDLRQAVPTFLDDPSTPAVDPVETPAIISVQNPDGPNHVDGAVTSVTFQADFNGDGCVAGRASGPLPGAASGTTCTTTSPAVDANNPEIVTYCWDGSGAAAQHLYLISGTVQSNSCTPTAVGAPTQPLVSGKISNFQLFYRSNQYRYDANGDGATTWYELDSAGTPVGNANGSLDTIELDNVSSVLVKLTTATGSASQSYQTQVDLRNVS
jgi:prepilin-type N-terminal cleavage/methylation domain-containing protein